MGIETASYITQLNTANPAGTDLRSTADNHTRLVKTVLKTQFPNLSATAVNTTVAELNLLASYTGAIPEVGTVQTWTAQQGFGMKTLADSATIAWDLNVAQVAEVTLAGTRVLDNPSNQIAGHTYILVVRQDATGTRSLSFASSYHFTNETAPILAKSANDVSVISFISDGTNLLGTALLNVG